MTDHISFSSKLNCTEPNWGMSTKLYLCSELALVGKRNRVKHPLNASISESMAYLL